MAECKFLIDSVVAAAMARVVPEMSVGDLKGGANHIIVSGTHSGGDYIHYEWPAAGTGASSGIDGSNAVRSYNEGDFNSIQSVETVEGQFPLRVDRCEIRTGSCGDGEFRGGFGLRRDVRILSGSASLSVLSDKNMIPPYGVAGGSNGSANRFVVMRDGKEISPSAIPGKVSGFPLRKGDIVREETSGGGGYGDPLQRSPEMVLADIMEGYLTEDQAEKRFGVVCRDGRIDLSLTGATRRSLIDERFLVALELSNESLADGPRRGFTIPAAAANRLGVQKGDLVEILTETGAPLRGWVINGNGESVGVDKAGLANSGC